MFLLTVAAVIIVVVIAANRLSPQPPAPTVDLGPPAFLGAGTASVRVDGISRSTALDLFRVDVRDVLGNRLVFSETLHAGTLYANGTATASFTDLVSPGLLNVGDVFRVQDFPTGVTYSLTLVYLPEQRTVASVTIPL